MKKHDAETKVVVGLVPQVITGAAENGDFVSLALYDSATVLYSSDVGTTSEDVTVTLRQAKTAAGGDAKDLDAGQWYVAQNVSPTALGDTFAEDGTAGEFEDDGETACVARVEVTADQLDTANDFAYVSVRVDNSGTGTTKYGQALYLLRGARYAQAVDKQPTVLT